MKIGIVVQRYGTNINGGAEFHARMLAEKLAEKHQVTVFTTRSESYIHWDNRLPGGRQTVNGIEVHRFESAEKDPVLAHRYYRRLRQLSKISNLLRRAGWYHLAEHKRLEAPLWFGRWLRHQGPYTPALVDHLKKVADQYDAFIFFTYLYYPTHAGLRKIGQKSIFIPTAHPEKPFYFPGYRHGFARTGWIMYNTPGEKELVEKTHPAARQKPHDIAGIGLKTLRFEPGEKPLDSPYFVYIGRIDRAKNVHRLIAYFKRFARHKDVKLVLIGKAEDFATESDPQIIFTGFVSDSEKNNWLYHSRGLIIPSRHESLSLVTLEAMQMGIPVVANRQSQVLRDHIRLSEAGKTYKGYRSFKKALNELLALDEKQREEWARKGREYVEKNYRWEPILEKFDRAFAHVARRPQAQETVIQPFHDPMLPHPAKAD